MNYEEFIEAVKKADKETITFICQLLGVDPRLSESQDLPSGTAHIAS